MPPHVLLLGGHGKVALHLTPLLLARSWNVTSVIRNPEHEKEILQLGSGHGLQGKGKGKGKVEVLVSSLDDVKSDADAQAILDKVQPDYVVWSAGAGGKGGPERTYAIDQNAAKHFIATALASPRVKKFLLISHLGSRRNKPAWMTDDDWRHLQHVNHDLLPTYAKAKLEADEYLTARAELRRRQFPDSPFQYILLRPGWLSDERATGRVALGKTGAQGKVTREDVAIVADRLLARDDTHGWYDLLNGDEPIDEAVERVVREGVDAVEGEDVEGMIKRFNLQ
ncbi:hypothetical protein VTN96DRAFT_5470 [Rasamsonia emersonii]|uniref:NAD(P)-binding domain-containing protein n=1 Tax=Rasamsonia emersonii (strain ATCC 16479 / CBS 393.64 / IMI 116815) TaxID=1408163 RepID=A0A0F4YUD6_RASE3|nr:hypothetical protein T310_4739 [Rasamsonia emersonii CBS 393.64]KKA21233.1 hypothetical protein T310_4739 [Rasamsonia emersonii CBS 393.64]